MRPQWVCQHAHVEENTVAQLRNAYLLICRNLADGPPLKVRRTEDGVGGRGGSQGELQAVATALDERGAGGAAKGGSQASA
jgi:hypothetical protein